jgi:predicted flap endonuclease-1-like 5' DNA nuclease
MPNLEDVEGIGPSYAAKLADAGLSTTDDLLTAGGSPGGRDDLAAKTGISAALILEWVNHVDLYRINGVGSEYADLLEAAGVDSVPELAQRNAANLTAALARRSARRTRRRVRRSSSGRVCTTARSSTAPRSACRSR